MKRPIRPRQKSSGALNSSCPRQSVASQLKILIEVGIATASEVTAKKPFSHTGRPTVNMWCAQTSIPANAIPIVENAIAL